MGVSVQATNRFLANNAVKLYDFDPDGVNPVDVAWVPFLSALEMEELPEDAASRALTDPAYCPFREETRLCFRYAYTDSPALELGGEEEETKEAAPLLLRFNFPAAVAKVAGGAEIPIRDLWSFYLAGLTQKAQQRQVTQIRGRSGSDAGLALGPPNAGGGSALRGGLSVQTSNIGPSGGSGSPAFAANTPTIESMGRPEQPARRNSDIAKKKAAVTH